MPKKIISSEQLQLALNEFKEKTDLRYATKDELDDKQDTLISGTNIKTINNTSLLGSGDIAVQPVIDSSHKLSADLVDDDNTTNKFVTASDKETWNAKQNAISSTNKLSADYVDDTNTTNKFVTASDKTTWNGKSTVSVSNTGTSTDEVNYITINGVEKKLPSSGSAITPNPESVATDELKKATIGSTIYQVQNIELSNTDYISDITLQFTDNSSETIEGVLLIENNAIYLEVE